jgi:arginase
MRLHVVTVPYRYDERDNGSGRGPDALIEAGLIPMLERSGFAVHGPVVSELPDSERVPGPIAVNVGRLGAHTAEHVHAAREDGARVLVLSGDDTAMVGVLSGLERAHGAGAAIGVVWLDAHGDFNTPETSYSGILAGMPVAILAGLAGPLWRGAAGLAAPVSTDRILIAGVRELDEREATLLRSTDVQVIRSEDVTSGNSLVQAIRRLDRSCEMICLHIDLDLLDPSLVPSSATPSPDGLTVDQASRLVRDVLATGKVAVLSVAGLNPGGGPLGKTSITSAMQLIERSVTAWIAASSESHGTAEERQDTHGES